MATRTVLVDDIDGTEGAETLTFGIDGRTYEIELAPKNRAAFDKAIAKYVDHARLAGRSNHHTPRRRSTSTNSDKEQRQAIREWAVQEGYEVPSRGRMPAAIIDAYNEAH